MICVGQENTCRKVTGTRCGINGVTKSVLEAAVGVQGVVWRCLGVYTWRKYDVAPRQEVQAGMTALPPPVDSTQQFRFYTSAEAGSDGRSMTLAGQYFETTYQNYISNRLYEIYPFAEIYGNIAKNNGGAFFICVVVTVSGTVQGSTYYGEVTSNNRSAYPEDGEQGGYWYVLQM